MTKKVIAGLLTVIIVGCIFQSFAYAEDVQKTSPLFEFELTSNESGTVEVSPGDVITINLHVNRTDEDEPYEMYAMQDEIQYDSDFFELVEDGTTLAPDIRSTDIAGTDNSRRFYMNYLSLSGGTQWNTRTKVGSIQLRVVGEKGVTKVKNTNYLVSNHEGTESFSCTAHDLTVILTTECTVKFESRGGTEIQPQMVQYGEKVVRPDDPQREGFVFNGWYADIDLTEPWDFEEDLVQENMTLYAAWKKDAAETETATQPVQNNPEMIWIGLLLLLILVIIIFIIKKNVENRKNEK